MAEENLALQQRIEQLEHIALAAALAVDEAVAPLSTPPRSPEPFTAHQTPGMSDKYLTPPSPIKSSRLNFRTEVTPDVPTEDLAQVTPPKMSKLDLKRSSGVESDTPSKSHLEKYV